MHLFRSAGACVALGLLAAGGCMKKITIWQLPPFETDGLKTVAVIPFRNATGQADAARVVAAGLANALAANGTYRVIHPGDLGAFLGVPELLAAANADPSGAVARFRAGGDCDAVLTGEVTQFHPTSVQQREERPIYRDSRRRKQDIIGYEEVWQRRNHMAIRATARLVRVSDGTTITALPAGAVGEASSEGSPPPRTLRECMSEAMGEVTARLVEAFAIVRKDIEVDPKKVLRIAGGGKKGDTVSPAGERMCVTVSLPDVCHRNGFRLTVTRKGDKAVLAEWRFVWQRGAGSQTCEFSPRAIAAAGGGCGEYVVRFHSGGQEAFSRPFRIAPP